MGLSIQYIMCEADQKLEQLILFLREHQDEKVIVYFLTCSCVDFVNLSLKRLGPQFIPGVKVHALHGRMKQAAREATLEAYTSLPSGLNWYLWSIVTISSHCLTSVSFHCLTSVSSVFMEHCYM